MHPCISADGRQVSFIHKGDLSWTSNGGLGRTDLTHDADDIIKRYEASIKDSEDDMARWDLYERDRLFLPNSYPAWTPDGKWLIYTSMSVADHTGRPQQDIFAIDAKTGTKSRQITTNPSADRMPMISPDGKTLYFVSNRGKEWAVWKMPMPSDLWSEN